VQQIEELETGLQRGIEQRQTLQIKIEVLEQMQLILRQGETLVRLLKPQVNGTGGSRQTQMGYLRRVRRSGQRSTWRRLNGQSVSLPDAPRRRILAHIGAVKDVKEYIDFRTSIWVSYNPSLKTRLH